MNAEQIIAAQAGPKIGDLEKSAFQNFVKEFTLFCFSAQNQKTTPEVIEATASALFVLLASSYKMLTKDECRLAAICGFNGEFGNYFNINVQTIAHFLKSFKTHENRLKCLMEKFTAIQLEAPKKDFSPVMIEKIAISALSHYKEHGELPLGAPIFHIVQHYISKNKISQKTYLKYKDDANNAQVLLKFYGKSILNNANISRAAAIESVACRTLLIDYFEHIKNKQK